MTLEDEMSIIKSTLLATGEEGRVVDGRKMWLNMSTYRRTLDIDVFAEDSTSEYGARIKRRFEFKSYDSPERTKEKCDEFMAFLEEYKKYDPATDQSMQSHTATIN